MQLTVRNTDDLRLEINRLKGLEQQQALAIRRRFSGPVSIISTMFSLFPKSPDGNRKSEGNFSPDIVQLISSFILPFTLNKTIFRRSNFVVKAIVRLLSQKASRLINESSVSSLWDKIKAFIPAKTKKESAADYTILVEKL